jgi:hypothetical protein
MLKKSLNKGEKNEKKGDIFIPYG